jgi:hypothetical protein
MNSDSNEEPIIENMESNTMIFDLSERFVHQGKLMEKRCRWRARGDWVVTNLWTCCGEKEDSKGCIAVTNKQKCALCGKWVRLCSKGEACVYHPGLLEDNDNQGNTWKFYDEKHFNRWTCCKGDLSSAGCTPFWTHCTPMQYSETQ